MDPVQGIQTVAGDLLAHGQALRTHLVDQMAKLPALPFGTDDILQGRFPIVTEFSSAAAVATRRIYADFRQMVAQVPDELQRDMRKAVKALGELVQDLHPINDQQIFRVTNGNVSRSFLTDMMAAERVKPFAGEQDLQTRLGTAVPNRAIFALRDPHMDGALISIQTAFTTGLPSNIGKIIAAQDKVVGAPDTASFYSISNWERVKLPIGRPFILEVAGLIAREQPSVTNFVTLSPMPGFRKWLGTVDDATFAATGAPRVLQHGLSEVRDAAFAAPSLAVLQRSPVYPDLQRIAAHYITGGRMTLGGFVAFDDVANFHPKNGARFERLLPGADESVQGFHNSLGFMANYQYRLEELDANTRAFQQGQMARSEGVRRIQAGHSVTPR